MYRARRHAVDHTGLAQPSDYLSASAYNPACSSLVTGSVYRLARGTDGTHSLRRQMARFHRAASLLKRQSYDLATIFHGNEPQAISPLAYLSGARHIFKLPNEQPLEFPAQQSPTIVELG